MFLSAKKEMRKMKFNLMIKYKIGGKEKQEKHEIRKIVNTPRGCILELKEPGLAPYEVQALIRQEKQDRLTREGGRGSEHTESGGQGFK